MAIILARLNCRIYPKFRRVFSFFRQHLRSKRELVIEDSKKMFKISRGKFFCSLKLLLLIHDDIVAVAAGNCSCYSKGAFLWDDLDQDQ